MQETTTKQFQRHDYVLSIRRHSQEIEKLIFGKEYMNYLAHSMRNLRSPLNLYFVFLKDKLISFRLLTVTMGYIEEIKTDGQFITTFSRSDNEEHDFLCELYMHNLIMVDYESWDPNHRVGELQLSVFIPFIRN